MAVKHTYTEIASKGARVSGKVSVAYARPMKGGVKATGTAIDDQKVTMMQGGIKVGGFPIRNVFYNSPVMQGGVLVSGIAAGLQQTEMSGGVSVSGEAFVQSGYEMDGGALAGGIALPSQVGIYAMDVRVSIGGSGASGTDTPDKGYLKVVVNATKNTRHRADPVTVTVFAFSNRYNTSFLMSSLSKQFVASQTVAAGDYELLVRVPDGAWYTANPPYPAQVLIGSKQTGIITVNVVAK